MAGGLAGLAFIPEAYDQTGNQVEQLIQRQVQNEGLKALGRSFQDQFAQQHGQVNLPGAIPMPGAGGPAGGPMPGMPPGGPGAPVALSPPPFGGGMPPGAGMPGPGMAPPGLSPPPGGPPGGGPMPGVPSAPPGAPGVAPSGPAPTPGALPGGAPFGGGFSWQDLARRIVQANPGARPEVIASAVTQAMPLMNMESQAQWKAVSAQFQAERLENARRGLEEKTQHDRALEDARQQGLRQGELRLQLGRDRLEALKDDRAARLQLQAEKARTQALQFDTKRTDAQNKALSDQWYKAQRSYYDYMRTRIQAQSNIPNAKDRDAAVKALDDEWNQFLADRDDFERGRVGGGGGGGPGPASPTPPAAIPPGARPGTPGAPPTPGAKPAAPTPSSTPARPTGVMPQDRVNQGFGDLGSGQPLRQADPAWVKSRTQYFATHPGELPDAIRHLTEQGYVVPPEWTALQAH